MVRDRETSFYRKPISLSLVSAEASEINHIIYYLQCIRESSTSPCSLAILVRRDCNRFNSSAKNMSSKRLFRFLYLIFGYYSTRNGMLGTEAIKGIVGHNLHVEGRYRGMRKVFPDQLAVLKGLWLYVTISLQSFSLSNVSCQYEWVHWLLPDCP